jgi:hypothetical protein
MEQVCGYKYLEHLIYTVAERLVHKRQTFYKTTKTYRSYSHSGNEPASRKSTSNLYRYLTFYNIG